MEFNVIRSTTFKKNLKKLSSVLQKRVEKILKDLETKTVGTPLLGDLQGFYSKHFEGNSYRLVYHKEKDNIDVLAVSVGKRKNDFYDDLKRDLKIKK